MSNKAAIITSIGFALIIVSLLIWPMNAQTRWLSDDKAISKTEPVLTRIDSPALEQDKKPLLDAAPNETKLHMPELAALVLPTEKGFELKLDEEQYAEQSGVVSTADYVVHAIVRTASENAEDAWTRYDAVVVNADTLEVNVYPMYELNLRINQNSMLFSLIDDSHVRFIRPSIVEGQLIYDVVSLNIQSGEIQVIVPRFWAMDMADKSQVEDFFVRHFIAEAADASHDKLMLSTFQGRVWQIEGTEAHDYPYLYPAYGDPGSKPPRELIFPSPDLSRFVYQYKESSMFQLVDAELRRPIKQFSFEAAELTLMDPGIVWSPDNQLFFIEYSRSGEALLSYTDNQMLVFAQGIRFYNRDGEMIRTLELPAGSSERVNVYGWAEDGSVWLEYFQAEEMEEGQPLKHGISYKRYDIQSGKFIDYTVTEELGVLKEPTVVTRHEGLAFRSLPFLLVDKKSRVIWQPPSTANAFVNESQLYMQIASEYSSQLFRWNPLLLDWEWKDTDADDSIHVLPTAVLGNEWLLYKRNSPMQIDYVNLKQLAEGTAAEGLPSISGKFKEVQAGSEWWLDDRQTEETEAAALRATAKSRYGNLQIKSQAGEKVQKSGGKLAYHGNYDVTFTDTTGKKQQLPPLMDLSLYKQSAPAGIRIFQFDGYDVLWFQPNSFRFSRGYEDPVRNVIAYAVTEQGEAFPLQFQFATSNGIKQQPLVTIDDYSQVEKRGEHIVIHSLLEEGLYELALQPSVTDRTLTVVGAVNQTIEHLKLMEIVNRYSNRIEQALGLEEINLPEGRMSERALRGLFTEQAWVNPGFQMLRQDFAISKQAGNPSRAFGWNPLDAKYTGEDTIRFTFTLNLWYAIGLAAHLEVELKRLDGGWQIHDLGTLETERLEDNPDYSGILIVDPIED